MLVQERPHHIVDEFVLPVEHVEGKGGHKGDEAYEQGLAQDFKKNFKEFLHFRYRLSVSTRRNRRTPRWWGREAFR